MLKERLKSRNNSSLTNIDFLATESVHKKENKFAEYQEIMKKMKSISKWFYCYFLSNLFKFQSNFIQ